jgi:hypothetical protein
LLVPAGNVYKLSQCVLELLNDKQLRESLGKRAREHVMQNFLLKFNIEAMNEEFKGT